MDPMSNQSDMLQSRFLEPCGLPAEAVPVKPFVMVIFGGTGDLSQRKLLPTLYEHFKEDKSFREFLICGVGSRSMTDDAYRQFIGHAVQEHLPDQYDEETYRAFARRLRYFSMDVNEEQGFKDLCAHLQVRDGEVPDSSGHVLFYLAVPPALLPAIIAGIQRVKACGHLLNSKIIIEKPFGHDRASAIQLNQRVAAVFEERNIYRIDHYLGKDTVQSLIFFRFGNSIFEPLWNRRYIDHVQITALEQLGIEHRARFYEQAGVVRDIVQNHMLQLLALVAMEPPVGFEADFVRDEKVKVFRTVRPLTESGIPQLCVRGQYGPGEVQGVPVPGYRQEDNVPADSMTPTFFAGKFHIDNWRWAGVPFYVRAGKRCAKTFTEIAVRFKQPPLRLFGRTCDDIEPNTLVFSIQPQKKICLNLNVKYPGLGNVPHPVPLEFDYDKSIQVRSRSPYKRLLLDCLRGDLTLFARQDGIEAMWSVVDPINVFWQNHPEELFPNYTAGTWGPGQGDQLIRRDGRSWHNGGS